MANLDKITRLAMECGFDKTAPGMYDLNDIDLNKVKVLGEGTKHDTCASTASKRKVTPSAGTIGFVEQAGVCHAFTPDGRCVSLFKTLYTNACQHDCQYCPNATSSTNSKIFSYTPEELAKITIALYRHNSIEGLFLSSGVSGREEIIMEQMLDSVRLLRQKYNFQGYIHLKILPGTSLDHIKQAVDLVDRVSLNVESPSKSHMSEMSHTKDYECDILRRQGYVRDSMEKRGLPAGQTTQFVVGASCETDKEIFDSMLYEYDEMKVKRAYFAAFSSVPGTGFEGRPSQPRWRENKLYNIDWLHRVYGFENSEIDLAFDDAGFLQKKDPKLTIAQNLIAKPLDPNTASAEELLRVPGIGPISATNIVRHRQKERIYKREQLKKMGVRVNHARLFIKLNGWADTDLGRWC